MKSKFCFDSFRLIKYQISVLNHNNRDVSLKLQENRIFYTTAVQEKVVIL